MSYSCTGIKGQCTYAESLVLAHDTQLFQIIPNIPFFMRKVKGVIVTRASGRRAKAKELLLTESYGPNVIFPQKLATI